MAKVRCTFKVEEYEYQGLKDDAESRGLSMNQFLYLLLSLGLEELNKDNGVKDSTPSNPVNSAP